VPDRVKPSFVILTSGHSDAQTYTLMATRRWLILTAY